MISFQQRSLPSMLNKSYPFEEFIRLFSSISLYTALNRFMKYFISCICNTHKQPYVSRYPNISLYVSNNVDAHFVSSRTAVPNLFLLLYPQAKKLLARVLPPEIFIRNFLLTFEYCN